MPALLDSRVHDEDEDIGDVMDAFDDEGRGGRHQLPTSRRRALRTEARLPQRARPRSTPSTLPVYKRRFKWLRPDLFSAHLSR